MCGIVVGLAFGKLSKRDEAMRQRILRYFTTELLIRTEERGKDATGAAILFNNGKYSGMKRGERAGDFLGMFGESKGYYGGLLKIWREYEDYGRVFLGHCRAGTTGDKEDNENNHPIKVGNIVGIHNGIIRNHEEIFKKLGCKRSGKVDSEAIFRMFNHFTDGGKEPFTLEIIQDIVNRLEGHYAITLFNADNLMQVPVFRDGRPVEFILLKKYGILLMVSEEKFWDKVHFQYERMVHYYSEFHSVKLPSFLNSKDNIEVKSLIDDSAIIFDLSIQVTDDTKIDDLGEWKKMIRSKKIWKESYTSSSDYVGNYRGSAWTGGTNVVVTKKDDEKKRRVFDNISNRYIVKIGDKELEAAESTALPVNKAPVDKEEKKETTTAITVNKKDKEGDFEKDNKEEEGSSSAELDDITSYSDKVDDAPKSSLGELGDALNHQEKLDGEEDAEVIVPEIVEVDMLQYSPAMVEAAERAYDDLSSKGYGNMEDLLSAIEIKDAETAEKLGLVIIANRASKISWKNGFMANSSEAGVTKSKRRDQHIVGLKSMILMLAGFFNNSRSNAGLLLSSYNDSISHQLATAAMNSNRKIDINELKKIFNSHEQKVIKHATEIMGDAEKYKKAGG